MSIAQQPQCSLELSARELRIGKCEVRQGQHIDLVLLGHLDHGRGRHDGEVAGVRYFGPCAANHAEKFRPSVPMTPPPALLSQLTLRRASAAAIFSLCASIDAPLAAAFVVPVTGAVRVAILVRKNCKRK